LVSQLETLTYYTFLFILTSWIEELGFSK